MKKRIFCALLAAAMLLTPAVYAAGGDRDDPIISLSYVRDTFIPEIKEAIAGLISGRDTQYRGEAQTARVAVSAGGSVSLEQGRAFVLTSGSACLSVLRGSVVNASAGDEAGNGAVSLNQRYIVCEDSAATVEIVNDAVLTVAGTAEVTQGDGRVSPFVDVVRGSWYFDDVLNCYERGFINGTTPTTYTPGGTLTASECVKLAACMHQLYHDGAVTFTAVEGKLWYRCYADYALENGIIDQEFEDYTAVIDRRQFVQMFYNALPEEEYAELNSIPDGAIPDVDMSDADAKEIYDFYRAGILTGCAGIPGYAEHAFAADTTITRAEVAAIMNRMFDTDSRVEFTIN